MYVSYLYMITYYYNLQHGVTALMLAVFEGDINVVDALLQHGTCVDMQEVVSAHLTEPHLYVLHMNDISQALNH